MGNSYSVGHHEKVEERLITGRKGHLEKEFLGYSI